jgi:26S proteasome regulatory subunit N7
MSPYLSHIHADNADLRERLSAKNEAKLKEFDDKLKEAEENQGESEISQLLRSKAMYLVRIGDKVSNRPESYSTQVPHRQERAIAALDLALEKTAGLGARIDLVLALVRVGLFFADHDLVTAQIVKATE